MVPDGHSSHTPATHSCPSAQRLKQLPQWRSFLCRFTHLSLQRVRPVGQAHTLSSPRLTQFLEQHWESLRHLRPKPLQSSSSAKATPGKEANAPPTRAAPINLMALPRERVPLASPLASSSKEWLEVSWLTCAPFSPKDGTRGLAPPVDQCSLVCRATKAGATSENYIPRTPVNRGTKRSAGVLGCGPSYLVGLSFPRASRPSAAAPLWLHRGTGCCGR